MPMMPVTARMTAAEFLARTEDQRRTELVAGLLVVHDPRLTHQRIAFRLATALQSWTCQRRGRGEVTMPVNVEVDDDNVFAPDVLWYAAGRVPDPDGPWPYPLPDLAIEVRSPSTWRYDRGAKRESYERGALPELWLVDTKAHAVLACRRSSPQSPTFDVEIRLARADTLQSPQLPGFALALDELFGSDEIQT